MSPINNSPGAVTSAEAGNAIAGQRSIPDITTPHKAPERPRMTLESFKPMVKGTLRGFATVRLPNGLTIADVPVCTSHGKAWASLLGPLQMIWPSLREVDPACLHMAGGRA